MELSVNLEKSLNQDYLYSGDLDSVHLFLSIIEYQYGCSCVIPKFQLMKRISTSIKRVIPYRRDRDNVTAALSKCIRDEVNRLELTTFYEGYRQGFQHSSWINLLERYALEEECGIDVLLKSDLFKNDFSKRINAFRSVIFQELSAKTKEYSAIRSLSSSFCKTILKKKIYGINERLNCQLIIDLDHPGKFMAQENKISVSELNKLYNKCSQYLNRASLKIYKQAFWYGLNDAVLMRYKK